MKLVMTAGQVEANPQAWLAARREGITASEIAQVLGIAPTEWGGPYGLYHKKLAGQETEDREELERGRAMEPAVLASWAAEHPGLRMLPGGLYAHSDRPWQMATFDALAVDEDTAARLARRRHPGGLPAWVRPYPVQAKTSVPNLDYGPADTEAVPVQYRAQLLWEMDIAQAEVGFLAVRFLLPWRYRTFIIERDDRAEQDITYMREAAEVFRRRLATGDEPPVDASPVTTATLRRLYPGLEDRAVRVPVAMARRYRRALAAVRRAEDARTLAANQLLQRAGNATRIVTVDKERGRAVDGYQVLVATRSAGPRKAYEVPAAERVDRMNPCGWAKKG